MRFKEYLLSFLIVIVILVIYVSQGNFNITKGGINKLYNVYLSGDNLGVIKDKSALFALIDEKQQTIKEKYKVNNVYPPNNLEVVETYSYNGSYTDIDTIYNLIEESEDFTILGYEIRVSASDNHKEYVVNVLDKEVFNEAVKKFILAFIEEDKYNDYMNNTQGDIEEVKKIYQDMGIEEDIVIKDKYISIKDKIYEDSDELAQDLLFGFSHQEKNYTVKDGDTIESVSDKHKLNPQEFLIANPKFSNKDSLLAIGDIVNVTLINPELSFAYKVAEIREEEQDYNKEVKRDNTKPSSYSEITTVGVKGLTQLYTKYDVVNGEASSEIEILEEKVIRKPVTEVTTKGKKVAAGGGAWGRQVYVDTGSGWRWPSSSPYSVTSEFKWRWGRQHKGMDISGAGFGSKIYAANDGVVTYVNKSCPDVGHGYGDKCGGGMGNYVVISHGNNLYTLYGHMTQNIPVAVGQNVSRGQVVGHMGSSGSSTGTHLHFGFSVGEPNKNAVYRNPRELFK